MYVRKGQCHISSTVNVTVIMCEVSTTWRCCEISRLIHREYGHRWQEEEQLVKDIGETMCIRHGANVFSLILSFGHTNKNNQMSDCPFLFFRSHTLGGVHFMDNHLTKKCIRQICANYVRSVACVPPFSDNSDHMGTYIPCIHHKRGFE